MARGPLPGDGVGIQVPVGRIGADRVHWQTIFDARDKPSIYRIHNGSAHNAADPGNAMIVEVDGAKRTIKVNVGTSVDVMGKRIRVKAGAGGETSRVEGWYVLVSRICRSADLQVRSCFKSSGPRAGSRFTATSLRAHDDERAGGPRSGRA